ncbi:MAG: response regulator [Candidatus Methylomirabilia bacterium]
MAIPGRILVVDDEPDFRQTCVRLLSKMGYHTLVASNGREALSRIDGEQPDLVVCDLRLPGLDGMGVLRHARTRPEKIPVILFSAFTTKTTSSKALEAGASAYLATPFTASELEAAVRRALK